MKVRGDPFHPSFEFSVVDVDAIKPSGRRVGGRKGKGQPGTGKSRRKTRPKSAHPILRDARDKGGAEGTGAGGSGGSNNDLEEQAAADSGTSGTNATATAPARPASAAAHARKDPRFARWKPPPDARSAAAAGRARPSTASPAMTATLHSVLTGGPPKFTMSRFHVDDPRNARLGQSLKRGVSGRTRRSSTGADTFAPEVALPASMGGGRVRPATASTLLRQAGAGLRGSHTAAAPDRGHGSRTGGHHGGAASVDERRWNPSTSSAADDERWQTVAERDPFERKALLERIAERKRRITAATHCVPGDGRARSQELSAWRRRQARRDARAAAGRRDGRPGRERSGGGRPPQSAHGSRPRLTVPRAPRLHTTALKGERGYATKGARPRKRGMLHAREPEVALQDRRRREASHLWEHAPGETNSSLGLLKGKGKGGSGSGRAAGGGLRAVRDRRAASVTRSAAFDRHFGAA
jgi:hypothetical protein